MYLYRLLVLIPFSLLADEKLRLKRADILENVTVNDQPVQYLNGNVQKPLVEKLKEQEWENSVYPIHTVCPSTKM